MSYLRAVFFLKTCMRLITFLCESIIYETKNKLSWVWLK